MLETTKEERALWFSLAPPGRIGFSANAGEWMEIAQKLGRDVDTLEEALRSVSFDCEVAFKDGGYDGVVPTIHDTARAVLAPKP